jgi:phosphatidylglycerol:prolipoprotein diacylglycerol transferase
VSPDVAYSVCVAFGAAVTLLIRRHESKRLGYAKSPGYRFVGAGCLVGAVVGAKLGMLSYLPLDDMPGLWTAARSLRFDGKTIVGALAGGYLFGELTKKLAGVRFSTGDALAVALPVGQAIGRLGCFFGGCCYGTTSGLPWAVYEHGALRHPVVLYESVLDLALAAGLFAIRKRPRPPGHLFRYYLLGYATIRLGLETLRGEPQRSVGPLSLTQVLCLLAIVPLALSLRRRKEPVAQRPELESKRV